MEKAFKPKEVEEKIYSKWEEQGYFTPKIEEGKKPFVILLPPPNANDPLHVGHALFVIEDILCRWHRMKGDPTLFLPGTDHAGIETQFVFEKKLRAKGKSRFDFDRETLYKLINDYVEENRGIAKTQLKRLGYSLDWTREKYTLEENVLKTVIDTFKKLHSDGLIYRGKRLVNYCTHCGTAFSNLEINHIEEDDFLYYIDYGPIQIATTRPETIFADAAVAVNPNDPRFKDLIGKKAILPILEKEIPIIADELVDPEFGTGALKITPCHDFTDWEIGEKHGLPKISIIDMKGRMKGISPRYDGKSVLDARKLTTDELEEKGKLIKVEPLKHSIAVCYRCKNRIEPLAMPQWFIRIKTLAEPAIQAIKTGDLKIIPQRFEKLYLDWMNNIRDWNISRQIVWGPRIPAWYCLDCNPEITLTFIAQDGRIITGKYSEIKDKRDFSEIEKGLQNLIAPEDASYSIEKGTCKTCGKNHILQETDTFDTWFSSGQWPLTTLGFPDSKDFKYFYPTSVLDTLWDILFFWVARMVMFGIYKTGKTPFAVAHMHCRVVDENGKKMSKSKGNVINPIKVVESHGADALRMALVFGTGPGGDISLGQDKLKAMRNFANKIWNASRFIHISAERLDWKIDFSQPKSKRDQEMLDQTYEVVKKIEEQLEKYRFGQASEEIYHFFWHKLCDLWLEESKPRIQEALPTLIEILVICLKLIHPFMPYVTEAVYLVFKEKLPENEFFGSPSIMISKWPEKKL